MAIALCCRERKLGNCQKTSGRRLQSEYRILPLEAYYLLIWWANKSSNATNVICYIFDQFSRLKDEQGPPGSQEWLVQRTSTPSGQTQCCLKLQWLFQFYLHGDALATPPPTRHPPTHLLWKHQHWSHRKITWVTFSIKVNDLFRFCIEGMVLSNLSCWWYWSGLIYVKMSIAG